VKKYTTLVCCNGPINIEHQLNNLNKDETQWEDFNSNEIGKTVFLTRESAEAALKKESKNEV